jgi:LacI family transcriptional regulator
VSVPGLDRPDPPTAIFAFNDTLAVGALPAARARGLKVPGPLSIAGFDDALAATLTAPALKTVRQPVAELGHMAAHLLMRFIAGQSIGTMHVELATKLIVRESTAPPAHT